MIGGAGRYKSCSQLRAALRTGQKKLKPLVLKTMMQQISFYTVDVHPVIQDSLPQDSPQRIILKQTSDYLYLDERQIKWHHNYLKS